MLEVATVSLDEILNQIKISCQIPSVIEGILTRKIISQTAQEIGIEVEPEELQQAADNLRLMNNLTSADATWSWLQKHSLSLDEFEELVYYTVISSKLAQYLFVDKVEPFFVEHQIDYAQVVMYEVVLDDFDLAIELFYALGEGEMSFHEIAHQYIQDTELRRKGGYRGILSRADLKPEISAAVFAATPPQVVKPILTSIGAHLILVEEVIEPQLDEMLRLKILSDLFSQWLKQQIEPISGFAATFMEN
ncbi:PpiC-type peptidyl-prolyl cis-trans isomerase [Nostoc commune NIES-4072]|uniref:peptidylprolyl isomerase n=1 Tax=Nostoc commune NIES-4072 TaxID=2005467 RepID=A0A2R5G4P5_NOSCO|nr:peptidylprolyl isomerase [Nostoc commune]BBD70779.1 PpiC-type peptidyl-prolyl cis-trans isomerase [Nostoc commune HK-02]GBG23433.1 PpiC-type peptidyl-prolyl cis-trans isomerase [Nostoc commune NIES-4072]